MPVSNTSLTNSRTAPLFIGIPTSMLGHTSTTLIIRRAPFKQRVAEISVKFELYNLGDSKVVRLEDTNRCVTVTFVYGKPKPSAGVTRILGSRPTFSNIVIQQHRRRLPEVQFRVLIIGRANAGIRKITSPSPSPSVPFLFSGPSEYFRQTFLSFSNHCQTPNHFSSFSVFTIHYIDIRMQSSTE